MQFVIYCFREHFLIVTFLVPERLYPHFHVFFDKSPYMILQVFSYQMYQRYAP